MFCYKREDQIVSYENVFNDQMKLARMILHCNTIGVLVQLLIFANNNRKKKQKTKQNKKNKNILISIGYHITKTYFLSYKICTKRGKRKTEHKQQKSFPHAWTDKESKSSCYCRYGTNGGLKSHGQTYFVDKWRSVAAFYNLTVIKPNIKS